MTGKIIATVLLFSSIVFSQSKGEKIRTLLDLMGSEKNIEVMKTQFTSIIKSTSPDVPVDLLDSLFNRMDKEGLYAITVPIYESNLTEETIDGLIEFYQTEAGRDFVQKMPVIMQQSMQAGAMWGKQIMIEVIGELQDRGYDVKQI